MRLTIYTDFSLRLLMYLAVRSDGISTIGEVADAYRIPKNHLTKVAHQLGLAGYITTVRGKGGGIRLAKLANQIRLGDVVRRTEPDMALVPCFEPVCAPCPIVQACGLRGALSRAQSAFLEVLDGYTLADIAKNGTELRAMLGIPARSRAMKCE
jgi:Rrf2 family nitric oxide-sensitive transcriptional repressor